ncbi:MAG TPA: retroviral-like aspartic protease family protein [Lacipirellulaceae bacterium]
MGITYVDGKVTGPSGHSEELRFLVDSGASYTLLPEPVWRALGLQPQRTMQFSLADGTLIKRNISECFIELPEGSSHTPVVLGEVGDDQPLLGVVTLENLGLVFDPFRRELRTMMLRM